MATYSWSTITEQEALGFTDGDRLIFDTAGASALNVTIGWGNAVTTLALGGKSLRFLTDELDGQNFPEQFIFLDGSNLLIDGDADDGTMAFESGGGQAMGLGDEEDPTPGDATDIGGDIIDGSAADESIFANGNRGDDSVLGGAGADSLFGGQGWDSVIGGDGDDSLNGNLGEDLVSGDEGADTIYGGQDDDVLNGGDDDDWLSGDLGDDIVNGDDGADTLFGMDGDDGLNGGAGDDSLSGNAGEDIVDGGDDNDVIYGGRDDDELSGGAGDDVISGDLDDDLIDGGEGVDELTGGEDDDTFFFETGDTEGVGAGMDEDDVDVITDFADDDTLQFDNATGVGSTVDTVEFDDFDDAVDDLSIAGGFGGFDLIAAVVEEDDGVYVFADINGDDVFGAGDVVVFLTGVAEGDLDADNLAFL